MEASNEDCGIVGRDSGGVDVLEEGKEFDTNSGKKDNEHGGNEKKSYADAEKDTEKGTDFHY